MLARFGTCIRSVKLYFEIGGKAIFPCYVQMSVRRAEVVTNPRAASGNLHAAPPQAQVSGTIANPDYQIGVRLVTCH